MDAWHERLIRVGLDAVAADFGFALAGGYAVNAHGVVRRPSDDVDLFTSIERSREMGAATDRVAAAYEAGGCAVEVGLRSDRYVRLNVADPAIGRASKVDLVAEFLEHPPVASPWGPVLHLDDVAAGKVGALFARAEARDFIDVEGLLRAGYSRDRLLELARRRDRGFHNGVFADMLGSLARFSDREFARYEVDDEQVTRLRAEFADWKRRLVEDLER
ncbi:MAG: nucleotidyl transferase AbiEii/AbiGii toxin family protein [Streptomycetaceae bacterium]|nr:nucleotidyl transferase AbiEii/AbiGii toxin family protein [Streptomycetaceae bacterium]